MKVHRIITTIEVENDNSITSVEVTNLHPTNNDIPLAVTNITTNGSANDIEQVYYSISKRRLAIAGKLKVSLVLLMKVLIIMNVMKLLTLILLMKLMMITPITFVILILVMEIYSHNKSYRGEIKGDERY